MPRLAAPPERCCRTCGQPIRFVRDVESGRVLVLNRHPIEGGNVVLVGSGAGQRAQLVPSGAGELHTLHFCPGGRRR